MTITRKVMQELRIMKLVNDIIERNPKPILKEGELAVITEDNLLEAQKQILSNVIMVR